MINRNLVGFVFLLWLAGCGTRPNPAVCCVSQADCNALGVDEMIRECADGLVCVDHACVAPQCELDLDCDPNNPFCVEGTCVACRDEADCGDLTPICDVATRECRACVEDADCESQACDFETGACLAPNAVLYASPTGSDQAECSQSQPCSVTKAVSAANAARPTVKLASGVYNANLVIDRMLSLHGKGATVIVGDSGPGLLVINSANARVYDLSLVNNNTTGGAETLLGILCESRDSINTPRLSLTRVVVDTQRMPMFINLCRLTVSQSTVKSPRNTMTHNLFIAANGGTAFFDRSRLIGGNSIGAIESTITFTNSIIEGVLASSTDPALVTNLGSISISYSTVFDTPLNCTTGAVAACASSARDGVCIENSIVNKPSSLSDTITGDRCRCDYCLVSPQQGAVTGSNNLIGDSPEFVDSVMGDFHLRAESAAIDAAHPTLPGTADFDGVARPQNGRSDLGAFEFKP